MWSTLAIHVLCTTLLVQACPEGPHHAGMMGKAVYLQSNEQHNSVISIPIGKDGKLYGGVVTATGGEGGDSIVGSTNAPAGPDALSSQGSVVVSDDYLFAVNAGSNSLSMFKIDHHNGTSLSRIGEPSAVPGEFPVSVAASVKRNRVCVAYTGAKAGVSCAFFSPKGLSPMEEMLDFELDQTTPPKGPTNTVAQVFFAANDTRLITTVKGDPTANKTGFISVLPFNNSCSSTFASRDTRSSPSGTAVLFGGVNVPHTNDLFLTDASFGTALLTLNPTTNKVSLKQKTVVPGQQATCWAAYSRAMQSFFVTDAAVNRLIEISGNGSKIISNLDLTNGEPGNVDLQVSGRFAYVLAPGNGSMPAAISVVDSFEGRQIQSFALDKLGAGKRAQGLAILE